MPLPKPFLDDPCRAFAVCAALIATWWVMSVMWATIKLHDLVGVPADVTEEVDGVDNYTELARSLIKGKS